jgi:hypothetical protein
MIGKPPQAALGGSGWRVPTDSNRQNPTHPRDLQVIQTTFALRGLCCCAFGNGIMEAAIISALMRVIAG